METIHQLEMDFLGGALIDRFVYVTNCYKFLVLSLSLSLLWGTVFFDRNVCITMQKIDTIWRFSIPSWKIVNTTHHWLTNFLFYVDHAISTVCAVSKNHRDITSKKLFYFYKRDLPLIFLLRECLLHCKRQLCANI